MVWTKERITFFLLACFTRIQHIAWRSKSKHENAIDDQKCSHIIIGLPGLRLPPNIGTSYFYKWNIVFTCWREVCIWSEAFPMKLIAKLALFCPSESLLPGQVLEVRYPCDKPLASNTMPPFAFPDSTRANPLEREHISEYRGPICVLNCWEEVLTRHFQSIFFSKGWDQNWLVAC